MSEITRNQLWETIKNADSNKDQILQWVSTTLGGMKKNDYMKQKVSNELVAYKNAKSAQRKRKSTERTDIVPPNNKVIFDPTSSELEKDEKADKNQSTNQPNRETPMEVDEELPAPAPSDKQRKSSGGKFMKTFSSLSPGGKRSRTDPIYAMCLQYVDKENTDNPDEEFTINNLLGYLLKRVNYHPNPKVADIGKKLEENKPIEQGNFDVDEAITLSQHLDLTKEQQQIFKNWMSRVNVKFPGYKARLKTRRQMKPAVSPLSEFNENPSKDYSGVAVPYRELVLKTDASIFDVINFRDPELLGQYDHFEAVYKDGSDGSGSQPTMQTASMYQADENIYQHSIVPLRMEGFKSDGTSDTLWRNRAPNAAKACRPSTLIRSKETKEVVAYDVRYVEKEIKKLQEESAAVVSFRDNPDKAYQVKHEIKSTMKDLKMKKTVSGLGGAECILCEEKQSAWMNKDAIQKGFPITRTVEKIKDIWDMMAKDQEEGKKTDSAERKGQTQEPITEFDQYSICITHTYINVTNWFLKLLARLASDRVWVESSTYKGEPIRRATKRVQDAIGVATGKEINQVANSVAKTGGSTTGQVGREFFTEKFLPVILDQVPERDRENVTKLHRNLSAIFRVISCTRKVDMVKFEQLTQETSIHIAENFRWARINYTLHGALSHSTELIGMNDECGLGEWSEEALEANNKFIRRFAETRSRKCSANAQLTDVLGLLIERSCPFTLEMQQMVRPAKDPCKTCGSKKHATSSHSKHANHYDDVIFNDIVLY